MESRGKGGRTETRTPAAFRACRFASTSGCKFRFSSPIRSDRSCSTSAFAKSLMMTPHRNTSPLLHDLQLYVQMFQQLSNVHQLALLHRAIGIEATHIVLDEHRLEIIELRVVLILQSMLHDDSKRGTKAECGLGPLCSASCYSHRWLPHTPATPCK